MKRIISASRRTDIPRYFGEWFRERRKAGSARFRNSFGVAGEVSLEDGDLAGFLFWTRFAGRFQEQLAELRRAGVPYAFQYTINGYGPPLEMHNPGLEHALADFRAVCAALPGPEAIQWRYDPIVVSGTLDETFHRARFRTIARALEGSTRVVNTSLVEPYVKTVRRVADGSVKYRPVDPKRHKSVARRHPDLPEAGDRERALLEELGEIAARHGLELRACCNPEWGLPPSQCAGPELFSAYGLTLHDLPGGPTRPTCRCVATVDIGMDNTCLAGCRYCYVVASHATAVANFRRHDPAAGQLRADRESTPGSIGASPSR